MSLHAFTLTTPIGPFSVAVDDTESVVATAFGESLALRNRVDEALVEVDASAHPEITGEIAAYFAGSLRSFSVRMAPRGSPFQLRVWKELAKIGYGERRSYGELARNLGSSPRAVGRANATNPVCLFIPCHRVIGADGSLTGYAFGEAIKRYLLDLEGRNGA